MNGIYFFLHQLCNFNFSAHLYTVGKCLKMLIIFKGSKLYVTCVIQIYSDLSIGYPHNLRIYSIERQYPHCQNFFLT